MRASAGVTAKNVATKHYDATMIGIRPLRNSVLPYAWGSRTDLAELRGRPSPTPDPEAELWMGAHPAAPSHVRSGEGQWVGLDRLIELCPEEILGAAAAGAFAGRLPFLYKVLAAADPLSIQVHPNLEQARVGFEREEARGIPLSAPHRSYRDRQHKPELVCALKPFWVLYGFRPRVEILALFEQASCPGLSGPVEVLRHGSETEGRRELFLRLLGLEGSSKRRVLGQVGRAAAVHRGVPAFDWVRRLLELYPQDTGVLAPLYLNLVQLVAGQALFLPAGILHSYLGGLALEVMANSDNVVRGGLTAKHVDLDELCRLVSFETATVAPLLLEAGMDSGDATQSNRVGGDPCGERAYPVVADEFGLSVLEVGVGSPYESPLQRGVEILLCTAGESTVTDLGTQEGARFRRGDSLLVPAAVSRYRIAGEATWHKAFVPC